MLITVTTTSTSLNALLSAGDISNAVANSRGIFRGIIQNLGNPDIYFEFRSAATLAAGVKIVKNGLYTFEIPAIGDLNLISDTLSNTNVRVSFN